MAEAGTRVVRVSIDELDLRYSQLRPPCPPSESRLRMAMEIEGIEDPVLASDRIESTRLVLVDGYKRVRILRGLGRADVLVQVEHLDEAAAKVAILRRHRGRPGLSDLEEGWIIRSLHREQGVSQVDIAESVGRDKSWVSRRLGLVERLDQQVQQDVRLGLISTSMARELAALPRGNQVEAARAIATNRLSSRQAARLVRVLIRTDASGRAGVLANPLEHVLDNLTERTARDPRLGPAASQIRENLLRMGAASNRVIEAMRSHPPAGFARSETRILADLAQRILPIGHQALSDVAQTFVETESRHEPT